MDSMNSQYVQQVKYADTKAVGKPNGYIDAAVETVKQHNVELNTLLATLNAVIERIFGPEDANASGVESAPYPSGTLPELAHNLDYQKRLLTIAAAKAERLAKL